ncbi:MAG: DNA replication/repair protein RecF [Thermomicrobiales bacterium]
MESEQSIRVIRLDLEHFRVYSDASIAVPESGLRIIGPNGTGKSTLLEAIELLSTTRPRRGSTDADLIAHGSGIDLGVQPYARVAGSIKRGDVDVRLEVFIQRTERRGSTKKLLRVADRPRRAGDVVGLIPTVTFAPDDLDLVLGPPSVRRRFLDIFLSQIDRRYLRNLSRYAKIVTQRNGLLRQVAQEGGSGIDQFAYWDEQLVALGSYIVAARAIAIGRLAHGARQRFATLSDRSGELRIAYAATIRASDSWWEDIAGKEHGSIDAAQRVAVSYEQQLRDGLTADIARGATLIGPHRDDLTIMIGGHDISRYGSRGQQRLAVLALKLAELDSASQALDLRPILLLDDVLSELDAGHQQTLLDAACQAGGQLLITSTDRALLARPELAGLGEFVLERPGQPAVAETA